VISEEDACALRRGLESAERYPTGCRCSECENKSQSSQVTDDVFGVRTVAAPSTTKHTRPSRAQRTYPATNVVNTRVGTGLSQNSGQSSTQPSLTSGMLQNAQNTTQPGPTQPPTQSFFVIFGIKSVKRLDVVENIEITQDTNDPSFFKELKTRFTARRSLLLHLFSPFRFQYCQFVEVSIIQIFILLQSLTIQFEIFDDNHVYCKGEGIPDPPLPIPNQHQHQHQDYVYSPRPPEARIPLIDHGLFSALLNACPDTCPWSWFHTCKPLSPRAHRWKRIPRKNQRFETKSHQIGESAYGIEANYVISAAMMTLYHGVLLAGGVAFFIYWLVKHPGDLQNASVPLFTALGLMASFWTIGIHVGER
jgi:hypothetical protein